MSDLILFTLTIIPLVFTPGPDMIFILSQVVGKDAKAGVMATLGVCCGYLIHSILVALGISAIIISYPLLFDAIRYIGVAYLLFLAFQLFKTAFSKNKELQLNKKVVKSPIKKGFFTALLNPKGMLIYFAILPQFMHQNGNTVVQGLSLSFIFIGLCFVVYSSLSILIGKFVRHTQFDATKQKWVDVGSGTMIMLAATWLIAH
ncbi:LysE family translocator [Acinetobacter nectaris]|uniref:LysE family translocator n=1 Tax=Acinetobacter nectaris TaxID=1219382 RepID=UPI001F3CFDF6|nr:LysE family translocator [Acinetobacter nectaris]MCF9046190.1 LysE family translocator [Acinetobacter nectaris]